MVKYILTPWRDREELLLVRHQFYAASPSWLGEHSRMWHQDATKQGLSEECEEGNDEPSRPEAEDNQQQQQRRRRRRMAGVERLRRTQRLQLHQAVARVSMWMQRGNCPHMVESTALLTAAVLSDEELMNTNATGVDNVTASSAYAVRAAYSAAFSRFVTGLLDSHQDKQRKQSMYSLARTIGLPATFVELRHQSTHEQLPSLAKLRSAAKKALRWIWGYYWRHLAADELLSETCEDALLRYLREEGDHDPDADRRGRLALERRWDVGTLLSCLSRLQGALPGNQAYVKCMRLSRELVDAEEREDQETPQPSPPAADSMPDSQDGASTTGWAVYQGNWKPKPIGAV